MLSVLYLSRTAASRDALQSEGGLISEQNNACPQRFKGHILFEFTIPMLPTITCPWNEKHPSAVLFSFLPLFRKTCPQFWRKTTPPCDVTKGTSLQRYLYQATDNMDPDANLSSPRVHSFPKVEGTTKCETDFVFAGESKQRLNMQFSEAL